VEHGKISCDSHRVTKRYDRGHRMVMSHRVIVIACDKEVS